MARKSAALRLSQASALYAGYQESSLEDSKAGRFIRDMADRLERSKGLSQGQRNWLDNLIEEGVPEAKGDKVLLAKIDEAAATVGMEGSHEILSDFRRKVFNGWSMSPKQVKWLGDILAKAEDLRVNGPWIPDEETLHLMRDIVALSKGYNATYWSTHGGTYGAVEKIRNFMHIYDEVDFESDELSVNIRTRALAQIGLDQWCIDKAQKAMSGRLRELREKPYVNSGDLVWTRYRPEGAGWNDPFQWFRAPVCGDPEVSDRGEVVYPVLNPARGLILVTKNEITKRKPAGAQ